MHMKRALIAVDDVHSRAWISNALEGLDLSMTSCAVAELGQKLASSEADVVVIDGGHSPEAAVGLVEEAVALGSDVRLLAVVESDALTSLRFPVHVRSDFMVRGGSSEELAARARGLLWPGEEAGSDELVRVDALTLNLATYQAYVGGEPVDFTYLEYALFAFLVTHPNRAYGRETLLKRVWGADYYGGSRTVDVHVRRVRAKIGGELSRRLETVRNVGYLWRS